MSPYPAGRNVLQYSMLIDQIFPSDVDMYICVKIFLTEWSAKYSFPPCLRAYIFLPHVTVSVSRSIHLVNNILLSRLQWTDFKSSESIDALWMVGAVLSVSCFSFFTICFTQRFLIWLASMMSQVDMLLSLGASGELIVDYFTELLFSWTIHLGSVLKYASLHNCNYCSYAYPYVLFWIQLLFYWPRQGSHCKHHQSFLSTGIAFI